MSDARIFAQWAFRYAERGRLIFPLRGKHPFYEGGFYVATTNRNTLEQWAAEMPHANVGLWPGPSGLIVFDVDGPEARENADVLGLLSVETLACITGRAEGGLHLYFKRPFFHVANGKFGEGIDIRCDGGYTVLPPSIHPDTGVPYRWAEGTRSIAQLPEIVQKRLEAIRDGLDPDERERPSTARLDAPPGPADLDLLEKRVRRYIDCLPTGLAEGQGRNNIVFKLSAWLQRDMDIPPAEALPWVEAFNATHRPPLRRRELLATFRSARAHGNHALGSGLTARAG